MRFPATLGALLLALCAALPARAQQAEPAPERSGYAFDHPRVLAQQRLFGIAHAVNLLATACRAAPAAEAAEAAHALWRVAQEPAIAAAQADLSRYYFGEDGADSHTLAQKLSLKDALDLPPDSDELRAACASLPEALQQPRYDLAERFRLEEMMARAVEAAEVEALERHCRPLFADEALALHEARYNLWREMNLPLLAESNKTLADAWPADAPAPSFAEWHAELLRKTQAGGSLAQCIAFSESLKQPDAALRNVFRLPPPLLSPPPLSSSPNPP